MKSLRAACLVLVFSILIGCGERYAPKTAEGVDRSDSMVKGERAPAGGEPAEQPNAKPPEAAKPVERKIIYTATIDLVVENFDDAQVEMLRLLKENKGYLAQSEVRGTPGTPRSGRWTLRVPVGQFEDFIEALIKIGELRLNKRDSKDITDAYYDLKAHIKNDEIREEGLRKLYLDKAASSKLEDLLAVDRELSAVRGKIDAQKGQLQRWDQETTLATVHVTLADRQAYVPRTEPEFTTVIGRTFHASVKSLVNFGKGLVLVVVGVTPWLPVIAIIVAPIWIILRRLRRNRENIPPMVE